tara:strand:+ start:32007 stop:35234 length:3228 start_codon:yes stop_codon:yes gene_type:complete
MKNNIVILFLLLTSLYAQFQWYNHPELDWRTIETKHFRIHYHEGTERSAREAAEVAEYVYEPITNLYDFEPQNKTDIIIKDVDDYSNGAAYFFENMIEIWAKPLDFDLRGSHRWIQNVIAHEFTHIVQIGSSLKYSNHVMGSYFQKLSYENEKREDVLTGYPTEIVSYPIMSGVSIPMWLAEGTAQYMYDELFFDYWDSTRDMLVRDRVLNNTMLTFNQMNTFGKCGMGNELVYNFGFSLVNYIADQYGEITLKNISNSLSKPFNYSINRAIKESIGITGEQLYSNWTNDLKVYYTEQISQVEDKMDYIVLESEGEANINPRWSPDGSKIAYLSNKEKDYFSRTDLFIYTISDSTDEKIVPSVKSIPAWINDSLIVYTKISKPDKNGSKFFDLYQYDFNSGEEIQLTQGLRLHSPIYNPIKDDIIALNTYDGTSNLIVGNRDFTEFEILTKFNNGIQIYSIALYNGDYLIDAVINHERDLYIIDSSTGELEIMMKKPWDLRDPIYKNNSLVYSDDRYGIYNIYLKTEYDEGYVTNLTGGAFKPDISKDGKIVFSLFKDGGYKLALLSNPSIIKDYVGALIDEEDDYVKRPTSPLIDYQFKGKSEVYQEKMTGPFFFPRFMVDNDTFKPGLYFFDNEALRHFSMISGFTMNSIKDIDLFLLFDYNKHFLTYYFNFYWLSRHTQRDHRYTRANGIIMENYDDGYVLYDMDYAYNIFSSDIGARFIYKDQKFWLYYTYMNSRQYYDATATQVLSDEYLDDFFYSNEPNYVSFDAAYDYYRAHSITLKYEFDARKRHYLYSMTPSKGYKINSSISYENNNIFEEFRVNDDYGGFTPYLATHNTLRFIFDFSKYSRIDFNNKGFIAMTNNIIYNRLSNSDVHDFAYFFGGGMPGLKGYSFYEPSLQGPEILMLNNEMSFQLFSEQALGPSMLSLSAVALSLFYQVGKSNNAKILIDGSSWSYDDLTNIEINNLEELLATEETDQLENLEFDALDRDDKIPDSYEDRIMVNVYNNRDQDSESIKDLKYRHNRYKHSFGIGVKLFGFSFYSYPTAFSYECHIPYNDPINKKSRHYIKLLFDF